jgi:DNA-binding NarL/FixJ family response regulator
MDEMRIPRALIVNRRPLIALGLQSVLTGMAKMAVIGTAKSLCEAHGMIRSETPDLLLVATEILSGEGMNGLQQFRQLSEPPKLVLTGSTRPPTAVTSHWKPDGVLSESATPQEVLAVLQKLFPRVRNGGSATRLTPRELDVARLVAEGYRSQQIARTLFISENTVKTHLSHITQKLGLRHRLDIVRWWHLRQGGRSDAS